MSTDLELDKRVVAALDLMRRLPPQKIASTRIDLINVAPDLCEEILCTVDEPLKTKHDHQADREYLICEYNRDKDSYRSPWSNAYYPAIEDGVGPSEELRKLEIEMNSALEKYREMYYGGGISSAYLWDLEDGFSGVYLIKNMNDAEGFAKSWDSIHVVKVLVRPSAKMSRYTFTSLVMVWFKTEGGSAGYFNLGGSITRSYRIDCPIGDPGVATTSAHISNIGRGIEKTENSIIAIMKEVYFGTARNIVDSLHLLIPASEQEKRKRLMQEVNTALQNKSNE